jgi:site-specific recombinase XerD
VAVGTARGADRKADVLRRTSRKYQSLSGAIHGRANDALGSQTKKSKPKIVSAVDFGSSDIDDEAPFTVSGFAKLVERAGIEAKLPFKTHPHMLRHATGYALANRGVDTRSLQAYLGHRSIQSTVRYTELPPGRFKNIWR